MTLYFHASGFYQTVDAINGNNPYLQGGYLPWLFILKSFILFLPG